MISSFEALMNYLRDSQKNYIFIQKDYLSQTDSTVAVLKKLVEEEKLINVIIENGYALAEVNLENSIDR